MQYFLSVDAGTTSFKAAIYDENWKMAAWHAESYELITPAQDIVEYSAHDYWRLFCAVTKGAIEKSGIKPQDIASLAIDSQGETLIMLDECGGPLGNAIVWLDNRAKKEAQFLEHEIGNDTAYKITGQPEIVPTWPASKIMWLKSNHPEIYKRAAKYLLLEDYLIWRLTGAFKAERALYPSSLYMDISSGQYWEDMLKLLGINKSQLPELLDSGVRAGHVTSAAASEAGLCTGMPVVTGALDQTASMIGAGNCKEGIVTETTGTALAVCATVEGLKLPPRELGLTVQTHAIPGSYFWLMWSPAGGLALEWFKNSFYLNIDKDKKEIFKIINDEAASVIPGSDGLIMLPHLCGAGTPEYDPHARGVFFGITQRHTRGHFTRAIMESIGYMLRQDTELLKAAGLNLSEVRSLGGGAKSVLWNTIKSDILGLRIINVTDPETTNLGAAILAAVGAGKYSSVSEACADAAKVSAHYEPDIRNKKIYDEAYDVYKDTYLSLKGLFSRTSK